MSQQHIKRDNYADFLLIIPYVYILKAHIATIQHYNSSECKHHSIAVDYFVAPFYIATVTIRHFLCTYKYCFL